MDANHMLQNEHSLSQDLQSFSQLLNSFTLQSHQHKSMQIQSNGADNALRGFSGENLFLIL